MVYELLLLPKEQPKNKIRKNELKILVIKAKRVNLPTQQYQLENLKM